ncbi:MAG: GlxA family transcriptional regulator [Pseudomonadota bacterium]
MTRQNGDSRHDQGPGAETSTVSVTFLLIQEFSMLSVASAIEPLRGANRLLDRQAYSWRLISHDGEAVKASNGMNVTVEGALNAPQSGDFLFVCAGLDADPPYRQKLNAALQRAGRQGIVLGSLSAGSLILARAGLLKGYTSTIHWEFQPAFQEEFPDLETSPGLYVIDRDRWTGSGGITGMDMMLRLIERDHGAGFSRSVGNQFQIDQIRNATVHQRPGHLERLESLPGPLQTVIDLMMTHIEEPLKMEALAAQAGLNLRRMERLFNAHLDTAPAQFYRRLRLEKARDLLLHTNLPTLEVACLAGFSSSSHFAMAYQRQYGLRPSEARRDRSMNLDRRKEP